MHFEQSAILTVNSHVITRNPRITVSHDKHRTWFLHINNVQQEDRGRYMCQINTITAKTQIGFLNVVGESLMLFNIQNDKNLITILIIFPVFIPRKTYISYCGDVPMR